MNFEELDKIIEQEAGVKICPICGCPFTPYHKRQITCAAEECRKAYRKTYMRERDERLKAEDIDEYRRKHAETQRRYRKKKSGLLTVEENLKRAEEYWKAWDKKHYTDKPDGRGYAEQQMAKTLAKVPKIDVSGFNGKGDKE